MLALVASSASATKLEAERDGKSLLNTFPFNSGRAGGARNAAHHDHHHHDDHHHHAAPSSRLGLPQTSFEARNQRQGQGEDVDLSIGSIAAAGERCIDKVVMQEETEYDEIITCKHRYGKLLVQSFTTRRQFLKSQLIF